jgi:hypothetical protein
LAITLSSVRDQVETQISDSTNLIFPTALIDEALRVALSDLSLVYGSSQTLKDLDSALVTTFDDEDLSVVVRGGVAYSLLIRSSGRFEEAYPEPNLTVDFFKVATFMLKSFNDLLSLVRLRLLQSSTNDFPGSWAWEEENTF